MQMQIERAGNCDVRALYRPPMLRRLLATFALITGLAALATPAEASWKRAEQAPAVAAAVQVVAAVDQYFAVDLAEHRPNSRSMDPLGVGRTIADTMFLVPVVLRADRALE